MPRPSIKIEKENIDEVKYNDQYKKPESEKIMSYSKQMPTGAIKEKFISSKTYKNGVVKNTLIGVKKNGSQLWGREK
jgi:hypothetical protein